VQRQLPGDMLLSVSYAGNHAVHLDQQPNLNQPQPNLAVAQGTVNVTTVRPYLGYGNITYDERNGSASYNALQTSLSRRMSHGLFLQASYSWSKSIVFNFGQNPFVQPNEEGLNSYDQPHNFTFSYVYDFPTLHRGGALVHAIVNGWETSGNATFSSGFPLTVTISGDRAGTGSGSQRPNVVGSLNITGNIFGYFNTSAFALPALGTFGNEGSNVLRGPGIANSVNLNFLRNISLASGPNCALAPSASISSITRIFPLSEQSSDRPHSATSLPLSIHARFSSARNSSFRKTGKIEYHA